MTDLDAIKGRVRNAYLLDRDDGDALERAMGDVKALVAEVERLRAEVAWLRSPVLPDEPCAACGHAKRTHHDYRRGSDDRDVTKCWGSGFDRDDCSDHCERFKRGEHRREEEK